MLYKTFTYIIRNSGSIPCFPPSHQHIQLLVKASVTTIDWMLFLFSYKFVHYLHTYLIIVIVCSFIMIKFLYLKVPIEYFGWYIINTSDTTIGSTIIHVVCILINWLLQKWQIIIWRPLTCKTGVMESD